MEQKQVNIDHFSVTLEDETNLLEVIRKAGIVLPTFCYHSEISVYGACRMCMVEVEGRGILPACSTKPEPGMVVKTNTLQIRNMRKMIIELILASHDQDCTTCPKTGECKLQAIAKQLGVETIRYKRIKREGTIDNSSLAILRNPKKCILCGDCVRVCEEIQSVGALGFVYRGAKAQVSTCFNKGIGEIECVNCGQCIKVCPVGALTPKYQISQVWEAIYDPQKTVVVQIAPAVRTALGEYFGKTPGTLSISRIISALRRMGFDKVYDTCFGADFTVVEEGKEFLERFKAQKNLPLFTSCCPAWVKFAEQYYPDLLEHLSTCRSPQQMFGAICKDELTKELNIPRENLVIVSVMPCTAKKFEAQREEFKVSGVPDVDYVITTKELALMIQECGIDFSNLELGSFDMPFGFSTGASVIFGTSGGVAEAVLRYAATILAKGSFQEFKEFRGNSGIRTSQIDIGSASLKLAVVSGLKNARNLVDSIRKGEVYYDLVEVMACTHGCVNGGGQPVSLDAKAVPERSKGLYENDKMLQFHVSSENPYLQKCYSENLTDHRAHELLHTTFHNRKRIIQEDFVIGEPGEEKTLFLDICFGTSCFLRGAQHLYQDLMEFLRQKDLTKHTEFRAKFCDKHCKKGPVLIVNGHTIEQCTLSLAKDNILKFLNP
ncbi:MAG: [FeFe] hydrogenase, group A [Deltaproteobacteria bacterium]|jgi:NADH-quinone oxidoreductase subunit G|nr:[FeFe] hydrogenase, group A [Deltaproteobacteria bacterium]